MYSFVTLSKDDAYFSYWSTVRGILTALPVSLPPASNGACKPEQRLSPLRLSSNASPSLVASPSQLREIEANTLPVKMILITVQHPQTKSSVAREMSYVEVRKHAPCMCCFSPYVQFRAMVIIHSGACRNSKASSTSSVYLKNGC